MSRFCNFHLENCPPLQGFRNRHRKVNQDVLLILIVLFICSYKLFKSLILFVYAFVSSPRLFRSGDRLMVPVGFTDRPHSVFCVCYFLFSSIIPFILLSFLLFQ